MLQMLFMQAQQMFKQEEGQGLVEYALILVLIAIVVIGVLGTLGGQIGNVFDQITNAIGIVPPAN